MGKNKDKLISFTQYCLDHPKERFWQALRNWEQESDPNAGFIYKSSRSPWEFSKEDECALHDTFYD